MGISSLGVTTAECKFKKFLVPKVKHFMESKIDEKKI